MSDDKKLTLAPQRPLGAPLGIKKTVDAGKVRQSFSHGRSKQVVVEVKKRKVIGRAGEEEVVAAPPPPPPEPAAPSKISVAPPPMAVARPVPRPTPAPRPDIDDDDEDMGKMSKQELLQARLRRAEGDRLQMSEEQRRRDDQSKIQQVEADRIAAEAKRIADAEAAKLPPVVKPAAKPAAKTADGKIVTASPADLPVEKEGDRRTKPEAKGRVGGEEDDDRKAGPGGALAKRRPEPAKPVRTRVDERRQAGKLTVSKALDEDENIRVRSLAALKRAREKERRAHLLQGKSAKQFREVTVPDKITVQELANRMAERGADVMKALARMDVDVGLTDTVDQDTAELIIVEFGHTVKRVLDSDIEIGLVGSTDVDIDLQPRPPVVTIMGHVDHGKTSLLDALRNTNVVAGEAGGITQHIGAYQILVNKQKITFLDTPGHEAFTAMRARGANITDIVILVVAADDGLMPQTIEAIHHVKAAGVPMIVAINKMDKPGANPTKVREALLQHDVQVEAFGGEVQDVEVSALKKTGLDMLAEKILLQAEVMELKANPARFAEGTVIEAELDKGRGPIATVLVRRGTLKVGDIFVIGSEWGKARAIVNDQGKQIKEAGPSQPVEVLGLSGVPGAGDEFSVVENEARAREVALYRQNLATRKRTTSAPVSMEDIFSQLKATKAKEYPLVVKADVQGSLEAIVQAINKISTDDIKARILHAGVGAVTESDVTLAAASKAPIICFNVRPNANARELAQRDGVAIQYYSIIYDLVDKMKIAMAGVLGPQYLDNVIGTADVRDVFQAGKSGKAAGCLITMGVFRRASKVRLLRDNVVMFTGNLSSLRRFKEDVAEVRTGLECGMALENFQEIKAGDVIEAFEIEERARTL
jgi:translation initiation factor IF-2